MTTRQKKTTRRPAKRTTAKRGRTPPRREPAWPDTDFARFFAQSLDLLCIAGFDGRFKYLNPAWTACLGWTLKELIARPFLDWIHPDDRAATQAEVAALGEGVSTIHFENRYRRKAGGYRWLQWNARPAPDRSLIYATARDVTEQKRLEQEVIVIADRERERLGQELHDGLCQSLAGIAALSTKLSRGLDAHVDPAAAATAVEITQLLNGSIHTARDLARGLSPVGLNELGLGGVLETLTLNVQKMFGVSCTLVCDPAPLGLPSEAQAQIFRIAQEALSNAVRHGRAARIAVRLTRTDDGGLLVIDDDGIGLGKGPRRPGGIGLHTMEYRARMIGASLAVRRRPGGGTRVSCVFRLAAAPAAREKPDHGRKKK